MKYLCALRLLLLLLCVTTFSLSQSPDATISGIVVDISGRVIPDAEIVILNEATGLQYTNRTNGTGIYIVTILPPGQYRVQVSKVGFKTLIKPGIVLNVQSAVALNFTLPLRATSESITVEAGSSLINTTDASVSTVINGKFVRNVPLNGRSFQDLISMTPGVVTQSPQAGSSLGYNGDFSVNGQRTESNYYTVDGVTGNIGSGNGNGATQSGTGGSLGGATALGTTQSLISVDALQEFRVQSSSYSAEYGRSPGGQFSLVTRSGTNNFHGSLFDYLRNNFFDANDWFNNYYGKPTPALRQNDFGGTLGGPFRIPRIYNGANRTFFFVSYEGLRLTQPIASSIWYVPDTFMRQQAAPAMRSLLNAWPIQNGSDYGSAASPNLAQFVASYALPSQIDSTSVRLDHTVSSKLSLFFRFGDTPSSGASRSNVALSRNRAKAQTYTLGASSQFSLRLSNDLRLGYDRSDASVKGTSDSFGGATPVDVASAVGASGLTQASPSITLSISGIGTTTLATPYGANLGRQWNVVDTLSASLGRHQWKAGGDFRRITAPVQRADPSFAIQFYSPKTILSNSPDYPYIARQLSSTPIFNQLALFVQDEWRVHPRLGLSLGLRWEVAPAPTEAHGNDAYTLSGSIADPTSLSLAPRGTSLWKTAWYAFAPRLGAAWTAHDRAGWETIVRAGGGVFFDNANQIATLGYQGPGFLAYKIQYGASLPFTAAQLDIPISSSPPFTTTTPFAFPSHMQPPYTLEWNASLQQALDKSQALTISYVGASGRSLIARQQLSLAKLNPNFGTIYYFPSGITSNYQALQVQFQRAVSHGLQALASYTWSHSLDFGSISTTLPIQRGDSDFDVRNNFQGGLSWELPKTNVNRAASILLNDWGLDGRLISRSAFPIPLRGSTYTDPNTGNVTYMGLNTVANQPIYLYGPQYAGGQAVNKAAFSVPLPGVSGNAPRNFVRGFPASQVNLAARREVHLRDSLALQFRAEAFNILNHPNFGYVDPTYSDAQFGQTTQMLNQSLGTVASQYQQGGPRSMQFALKLIY